MPSKRSQDIKDFNNGKIVGVKVPVGSIALVSHIRKHPILKTPIELLVKEAEGIGSASSRWEPTEGGWGTAELASLVGSPELANQILVEVGITKVQI